MDDLISRQAVIDLLKKNTTRDIEEVVVTEKNIKLIMDMPKAYDVDAVLAELEKARKDALFWSDFEEDYFSGKAYAYADSISIVKRGGVE